MSLGHWNLISRKACFILIKNGRHWWLEQKENKIKCQEYCLSKKELQKVAEEQDEEFQNLLIENGRN